MTKLISTWNRRKRHRYYFKRNLLTFFLGSWWAASLGLSTLSTLLSLSVGALTFPNWPEPDWWSSVLSCLSGPISHNFRVNSTGEARKDRTPPIRFRPVGEGQGLNLIGGVLSFLASLDLFLTTLE